MSEDRIDPFWEFCYETGIDTTGGELDTGKEELIEDEEDFVEECCCSQGLSVGSLQETTDYVNLQVRRLNMIEQLPEGIRAEFISQLNQGRDPWRDKGLSDAVWRLPLQSSIGKGYPAVASLWRESSSKSPSYTSATSNLSMSAPVCF